MVKRILALAAACLLLTGAAFAEVTGPVFEAKSMSDSYAAEAGAFIYTEDYQEGLVDLSGNVLCQAQFGDLSYVGEGYYEAINENGYNNHALVNAAGEVLIPYEYSDFEVLSADWVIAVALEVTDDADKYDYSSWFSDDKYIIARNDVWYMPEAKLAGSLERQALDRAHVSADGTRLVVEDRDGNITAYDASFNASETLLSSMYDSELTVYSENELSPKALYNAVTKEKVSDKTYQSVNSIDGGWFAYYDSDTRLYGIMTAAGEEICEPAFSTVSSTVYDGRYVKVHASRDDDTQAEGLYDLEARRLVVPCEYDGIYTWGDKSPINDGYVCVEQDGKLGFIDAEGNVTCPIQYAKDAVDYYGCTLGATDLTGNVTVIAADGTVTALQGVTEIDTKNRLTASDGYYLVVENADGNYGVVDWHGNQIVDFVLEYSAAVHQDDTLFTGSSIYKLTRG